MTGMGLATEGELINGLFGGGNRDTASYLHATGAVKVNLATPANNTGDYSGEFGVRLHSAGLCSVRASPHH